GYLDVAQTELPQPSHETVNSPLADRHLGQGAAEHDRNTVRAEQLELRLQVGGHERGAPAELDYVHAVAGDLEHPGRLSQRQPPVDDMGDAVIAWLGRPRRDVEEAGYGSTFRVPCRRRRSPPRPPTQRAPSPPLRSAARA